MARRDGEQSGMSPLILISGLVVIAGLAFGGAYALLSNNESSPLVVIKAPDTPVRVAPKDRGGLKLNSLDSPVMGLLSEQANSGDEDVEILVPPESAPELPPIDVADEDKQAAGAEDDQAATNSARNSVDDTVNDDGEGASLAEQVSENAETQAEPEPQVETVVKAEPKEKPQSSEAAPASSETGQKLANPEEDDGTDDITNVVKDLPSTQPLAKPKTPKIVSTVDNDAPSFVVQFAAFKSETRAKNTAAVLATKHATRLGELTLGYMKRDDFWRVVTEPMPRADATALCRVFRSAGQDCITKLMEQPQ